MKAVYFFISKKYIVNHKHIILFHKPRLTRLK